MNIGIIKHENWIKFGVIEQDLDGFGCQCIIYINDCKCKEIQITKNL